MNYKAQALGLSDVVKKNPTKTGLGCAIFLTNAVSLGGKMCIFKFKNNKLSSGKTFVFQSFEKLLTNFLSCSKSLFGSFFGVVS